MSNDEPQFELLRPGTYGVIRFAPIIENSTALLIRTKERVYYELSASDEDDFWEAAVMMLLHPHDSFLRSDVNDRKLPPLTYVGEAAIDGHPCIKFAVKSEWGDGHTTYFAAKDLKNLVIRIEWKFPSTGNFIEMFPLEGVTILRNVKLKASAKLFEVPSGFKKVELTKEPSKNGQGPMERKATYPKEQQ